MLFRRTTLAVCLTAASQAHLSLAQLVPETPFSPPQPLTGSSSVNTSSTAPNSEWSSLVGNLLWFYDAQRAGKLGQAGGATYDNRVSWRNDSTLDDGSDVHLDLSGGFFDAGDYLKFAFPLSFTLTSIAWGAVDFGRGYDLANQAAYLDSNLRWGLDWLLKCHSAPTTLYVQVGTSAVDNNYWGGDQNIPKPRTSFKIDQTNTGTDAAAAAAAAFAAGSALYQGQASLVNSAWSSTSLRNTTYADILTGHARDLYAFARNSTQRLYQVSVPAANDVYASSSYEDHLVWAALWLYIATNNTAYLAEANQLWTQFGDLQGSNSVLNWDSVTPALSVLFAQIYSSRTDGDVSPWRTEAERYFDRILNDLQGKKTDSNGVRSFLTSGGLLWYPTDSDEASLNPAMNAAMLMTRYSSLASSTDKGNQYRTFARQQFDYALGKNPMNVPYVVGVHVNSPINPHSAAASGGSDIGHIDTSPVQTANQLFGAVVGGPDQQDRYYDRRSDYEQSEIALDYNAPFLSLAAYNVINDPSPPFYAGLTADRTISPGTKPADDNGGGMSTGAKVAIAVVVIVVVIVVVAGTWWWRKRHAKPFKR